MGKNERVILIKGDSSKWYEQAIFIVKPNTPANQIPVDFVAEAEKIINNYLANKNKQPVSVIKQPVTVTRTSKDKRFETVLNLVMLAGCLLIAGVLFFGMTNP